MASHNPTRPLPKPSLRPLAATGPAFFVNGATGSDSNSGAEAAPWKTLNHAVTNLPPGSTLYLRGGVLYEHVCISGLTATAEAPIVIRGYPGELAVVDGGVREFYEKPAEAWMPFAGGAPGEYASAREFPDWVQGAGRVKVLGNFGDSMLPLHGYWAIGDMRARDVYWRLTDNAAPDNGPYCGPGVIFNPETKRIHIRLAHTAYAGWGGKNYAGEQDPRKMPLVVAGGREPALLLANSRHVRLQDLVIRGAVSATVGIDGCEDVELDGLTVYGGATPIRIAGTARLRLLNSAFLGIVGPWSTRSTMKYRGIESQLLSASGWGGFGGNRDFEIAGCEFTDSCDGIFIGNVQRVEFHHNLLDNCNDDGMFVTATTGGDGKIQGGGHRIYQNVFSRCLTTFAFGTGHGFQKELEPGLRQTGAGLQVYRNLFDLREPVHYGHPASPEEARSYAPAGRMCGDHGSPAWEPLALYHNTILVREAPWRGYYLSGLGGSIGRGAARRLFNNVVVHLGGMPGTVFPPSYLDFDADGNVHWSLDKGASFTGDFAGLLRNSAKAAAAAPVPAAKEKVVAPTLEEATGAGGGGKAADGAGQDVLDQLAPARPQLPAARPAPHWGEHDRFADPKLTDCPTNGMRPCDIGLKPGSAAVNAGVPLPREWPDVPGYADAGAPDSGALPEGAAVWNVGVRGRLRAGLDRIRESMP